MNDQSNGRRSPRRPIIDISTLDRATSEAARALADSMPVVQSRHTLYRGENKRPLAFDGWVRAEVHEDRGVESFHVSIYETKGGKFVAEFQMVPKLEDKVPTAKVEVFDSLDAACAWFRPGPLTTELLKRLGKWNPEFIE